jgi:hypothetical protein
MESNELSWFLTSSGACHTAEAALACVGNELSAVKHYGHALLAALELLFAGKLLPPALACAALI